MKKLLLFGMIAAMVVMSPGVGQAASLDTELSGRILLQVEEKGEAWYIAPADNARHYLGRPADAFSVMRELGTGINEKDYKAFKEKAPARLSGKILLRVEEKGEAYYVNPVNRKLYYLGRPADAFNVMRGLGLGITNNNLNRIRVSEKSRRAIPATPAIPAQPQDSPAAAIPATPAVPAQPQDSPAAVVPEALATTPIKNYGAPYVVYEVGVNNYPDHENNNLSVNIPYAYVNVYQVDPITYIGTLKQIINTGSNAVASVTTGYGEIIDFVGYASQSLAQAQTTYQFGSPPYKNFGQVDQLCQINYHVASQYLNNSIDYACSNSLSTPYQGANELPTVVPATPAEPVVINNNPTWGWKKATTIDDAYNFINGFAPYTEARYVGDIAWSDGSFYIFYRGDMTGTADWGWKLAPNNDDLWNFLNRQGAYTGLPKAEVKVVATDTADYVFYRGTDENASWGWKRATDIGDMYNFVNGFGAYNQSYWGDMAGTEVDDIDMYYNVAEEGDSSWGWKLAQTTSDAYDFLNRINAYDATYGYIHRINVVTDENGWFYIFYNKNE